jgi:hypothetical protein
MRKRVDGDAALAIGEDAFRAGFQAALNWMKGPQPISQATAALAVNAAWSDYDPPEGIKALTE